MEKNSSLISFSNSGIKKKITCQQFFRFSLQLVYLTATCDRSNEILINLHSRQLTVLGHLPVQNRYETLRCKCKFNRIHYFILARLCSNVKYLSRCEPKFFQVFISCCPKWVTYFHTQIQYVQWKHVLSRTKDITSAKWFPISPLWVNDDMSKCQCSSHA